MKFTDNTFKKLFMLLVSTGFTLGFVLSVHILFFIPLDSAPLWIGSIIMFVAINILYDIHSVIGKLITLMLTTLVMVLFFTLMLNFSLTPSIYVAAMLVSLVVLLYMTFVS